MRTQEEIQKKLDGLKEEARKFNTPFYYHDEAVVRYGIRLMQWVLGLDDNALFRKAPPGPSANTGGIQRRSG